MKNCSRKTLLAVTLMIAIGLGGCGEKMKTYENYAKHIRLKYPVDWLIQEETMGAAVTFHTPEEGPEDRFQENLSIVVQDLGQEKVTLKQYTEAVVGQLPRIIPNLQILENKEIPLSKNKAQRLVYKAQQAEFRLQLLQVWLIKDNQVYMITFTSEEMKYPKYEKTIENMLRSLKIM